jgi:hypothetical protein
VQIALELRFVISSKQHHRSVVGHFDPEVNAKVLFLNRGHVGFELTVDHKEAYVRMDGICDEPFQALSGVSKIAVFIEVEITSVTESYGHTWPPFKSKDQYILLLVGNNEAEAHPWLEGLLVHALKAAGTLVALEAAEDSLGN